MYQKPHMGFARDLCKVCFCSFQAGFLNIVAAHNDEISLVKHVVDLVCLVFTSFGRGVQGGGGHGSS